eukprot:scaffold4342_cov27-Tisochrysis_lutea.AAC.5
MIVASRRVPSASAEYAACNRRRAGPPQDRIATRAVLVEAVSCRVHLAVAQIRPVRQEFSGRHRAHGEARNQADCPSTSHAGQRDLKHRPTPVLKMGQPHEAETHLIF